MAARQRRIGNVFLHTRSCDAVRLRSFRIPRSRPIIAPAERVTGPDRSGTAVPVRQLGHFPAEDKQSPTATQTTQNVRLRPTRWDSLFKV
jgi:hypothetical protein